MLKSLIRYCRYFVITLVTKSERRVLWRDAISWYIKKDFLKNNNLSKETALHKAANWLIENQNFSADKGYSTYYIVEGHTSSYPETSGYIIDSLFHYAKKYNKTNINKRLIECADWLVQIQKPSGGWQASYVANNKPEVVFNTGQVIRGLVHAYTITNDSKYLNACIKACDWLVSIQEADGSWQKQASMNVKRTYDSYVSAPLLLVYDITKNEAYKQAAIKNLDWIVDTQQQENGWFTNADNTIKHNDRPILHTIAYTLDGLLDGGLLLNEKKYIAAAQKSADVLLQKFNQQGYLNGRYDKHWNGSEYMICTGCAQMSIIWSKLFKHTHDTKYLKAAQGMNTQLVFIQSGTYSLSNKVNGALQGSFPIWGKYEPFAFPNWATKYLLDALMLETEITSSN